MNGAVQGVATTAASTPVKNEPASPDRRIKPVPQALQRRSQMKDAR